MRQATLGSNYVIKVADQLDNKDALFALIRESLQNHKGTEALGINTESIFRMIETFIDPAHGDEALLLLLYHKNKLVGYLAGQKNLFLKQLTGKDVATQLVWYVKPNYRSRYSLDLLEAFELWAHLHGCHLVQTASPHSSALFDLYNKRGYTQLETYWMKDVR